MTQPKKTAGSSARKPAARKRTTTTTAKSSARSTSAARSTSSRAKAAAPKPRTTRAASSKAAPPKSGAKPSARRGAGVPTSPQEVRSSLNALRERLVSSLTLTPDRIQEAVDDAVKRGKMTRRDANELLTNLVSAGRQQSEALLADVEQLLGRGNVRERATRGGDAVLRQVDRARRGARIPGFPIINYDDLSAAQVTRRLKDLTPAQLRKVRDHERGTENRKSILNAIERRLR